MTSDWIFESKDTIFIGTESILTVQLPTFDKERKMKHFRSFQKLVACLVAVTFCYLTVAVAPVQAAMVGTADVLAVQQNDEARQKVRQFLERQDVVNHLQAMGVSMEEAQARVDTMTAEEINLLANKIDQMPAGGDAVGFLVALVIVVFVVLVITDIIGVTDVFTFIKKR